MLPASLIAGNFIKIPSGHIKESNWPGSLDNSTLELVIGSNMTAIVDILDTKKKLLESWEVQAFGFQAGRNICINTHKDTISGFFTGCYMASYRRNGARRVAHIYTEVGGGAAKNAFVDNVYNDTGITCCFKPNLHDPASQCIGIITDNNICYSLGVSQTGVAFEFEIMYVDPAGNQKAVIV